METNYYPDSSISTVSTFISSTYDDISSTTDITSSNAINSNSTISTALLINLINITTMPTTNNDNTTITPARVERQQLDQIIWEDYPNRHENMTFNVLNITNELPIEYAQPMYGYVVPFLLIITIIANTLIVVVLSKRHMRTPTNIVLMAMALCDMFTLLFPAPWLFYMYTFGNHYKPLSPMGACYAWMVMHEVSVKT